MLHRFRTGMPARFTVNDRGIRLSALWSPCLSLAALRELNGDAGLALN